MLYKQNEDAAAYFFAMTVVFLVIIAIVWAFLNVGLNPVVGAHNSLVKQGQVGTQSHWLAVTSVAEFLGIPGLILLGFWIASIQRAVEVGEAGERF